MADSVMDSSSGQDVSWLSTTTTSSDLISETSGDVESDLEQNVQGAERKGMPTKTSDISVSYVISYYIGLEIEKLDPKIKKGRPINLVSSNL